MRQTRLLVHISLLVYRLIEDEKSPTNDEFKVTSRQLFSNEEFKKKNLKVRSIYNIIFITLSRYLGDWRVLPISA